jgi:hypothetical protein
VPAAQGGQVWGVVGWGGGDGLYMPGSGGTGRLGRAGAVGTGEVLSAGKHLLVVRRVRNAIAVLVNVAFVGWCLWKLVPVVGEWLPVVTVSVAARTSSGRGCGLGRWLGLLAAGHQRAGQGRGRGRRGGAESGLA